MIKAAANSEFEVLEERVFELGGGGVSSVKNESRDWK
jgi:hypothetical protein